MCTQGFMLFILHNGLIRKLLEFIKFLCFNDLFCSTKKLIYLLFSLRFCLILGPNVFTTAKLCAFSLVLVIAFMYSSIER